MHTATATVAEGGVQAGNLYNKGGTVVGRFLMKRLSHDVQVMPPSEIQPGSRLEDRRDQ